MTLMTYRQCILVKENTYVTAGVIDSKTVCTRSNFKLSVFASLEKGMKTLFEKKLFK